MESGLTDGDVKMNLTMAFNPYKTETDHSLSVGTLQRKWFSIHF